MQNATVSMDASTIGTPVIQHQTIPEQPVTALIDSPGSAFERTTCHSVGDSSPDKFPLEANPSIFLQVLTSCNLDAQDLARLEVTCSFFRRPANIGPEFELNLAELAALDLCHKRFIFKPMTEEERQDMKQRCGGSWKLVLRFLMAGEICCRREKSHAVAGACHSVAVTSKGVVYSFGWNSSGQLGHGTTKQEWQPRKISSLQGVRIIQATAGFSRTVLISDTGRVYAFGKDTFAEVYPGVLGDKLVTTPQLVESLNNIFVVQVAIGNYFTAVLSREGRVYTFSLGSDGKFGHSTNADDVEPRPVLGALENIPVVQIAAGYCYLLALACQPNGMSVYSLGCGLGGKLGHGCTTDERYPRLIEQFQLLNFQPMVISAGALHAAAVGRDGRVCTWGWGRQGCLGHGNEECRFVPTVVEALSSVKAVHIAAGNHGTLVVSDDGDVYSFGCNSDSSIGHHTNGGEQGIIMTPERITSLKQLNERVVHISITNTVYSSAHTFALTESGNLYSFGAGNHGQLGVQLAENRSQRGVPERVNIDLS